MDKIVLYVSDLDGNNFYEEINASPIISEYIKKILINMKNFENYNIDEYKIIKN